MVKKSAFADTFSALTDAGVPAEPSEAIPQLLQHKPSRAKRNRSWERENKVTAFRGIPAELNAQLKITADELRVPVGELVRYLLERGLAAYERGELPLQPHIRVGAMTLYPGGKK